MNRTLLTFLSLVALSACQPTEVSSETTPVDLAPAVSIDYTLDITPLVRGETATFTVTGVTPGETIIIAYTNRGLLAGGGPCPGGPGDCIDLLRPVTRIGEFVADSFGVGTIDIGVPVAIAVDTGYFQATTIGVDIKVSPPITRPFLDPIAVVAHVDEGFAAATPAPDVDVVVVRERAYESIDLTGYGYGVEDYIQSVYVRINESALTSERYIMGSFTLSEGATILGVVSSEGELGGSVADGVLTGTDLQFGIPALADSYSGPFRGLESSGVAGGFEYARVIGTNQVHFVAENDTGIDDFRVLVDYGDSWATDVSFDIELSLVGDGMSGVGPINGFQVGLVGSTVFEAMDYGEVGALYGVPLIGGSTVTVGDRKVPDATFGLYTGRSYGGGTMIDFVSSVEGISMPNHASFGTTFMGTMTDGEDGMIYSLGSQDSLTMTDVVWGTSTWFELTADVGEFFVGTTNLPGSDLIYIVRDTNGVSMMDTYDTMTGMVTMDIHDIPTVSGPIGITDGSDGMIWTLGRAGAIEGYDPGTGMVTIDTLIPPMGSYVDLTNLPGSDMLYLLRNAGADISIDSYDVMTGDFVADVFSISGGELGAAVGITDGNDSQLYVQGSSGQIAAIHLGHGVPEFIGSTDDSRGFYRGITNVEMAPSSDTDMDMVYDLVDNCPVDDNPGQEDTDENGIGDVCDMP